MRTTLKQQSGFTLIELVMVIVILGILAATALPKFVDLRSDANASVAAGYGGGLSAAAGVNFSACAAKNFATGALCIKVAKCSDVGPLILPVIAITPGALPALTAPKSFYIVTDSAVATAGATASCSAVYGDGTALGVPFSFTAVGT